MERREWWQVEELVPAANAIGGVAYWCVLGDSDRVPWTTGDRAKATGHVRRLRGQGRTVRLVRVIEEEVVVEG